MAHAQTTSSIPLPAKAPAPVAKTTVKPTIGFSEFFVESPRELKPSPKLLALNGTRVRLIGFMAKTENPTKGEFYLCPTPVFCDEEGAGSADLPPETVTVEVRGMKGKPVSYISRPIMVSGVLTLGNQSDSAGHMSSIHLLLDRPEDLPATKSAMVKKAVASPSTPSKKVAPQKRQTTR